MRPAATRAAKAARLRAQVWSRWSCMSRWAVAMVNGWAGVPQDEGAGTGVGCGRPGCGVVPQVDGAERSAGQWCCGASLEDAGEGWSAGFGRWGCQGRQRFGRSGHRQPRASRTTAQPVRTVMMLDSSSQADIGLMGHHLDCGMVGCSGWRWAGHPPGHALPGRDGRGCRESSGKVVAPGNSVCVSGSRQRVWGGRGGGLVRVGW